MLIFSTSAFSSGFTLALSKEPRSSFFPSLAKETALCLNLSDPFNSHWAHKFKILVRDHCFAISHRSASDLTTSMICGICQICKEKKIAGIVITDVKGAFDGALTNRLVYRPRSRSWPTFLVLWVKSFRTNIPSENQPWKITFSTFWT